MGGADLGCCCLLLEHLLLRSSDAGEGLQNLSLVLDHLDVVPGESMGGADLGLALLTAEVLVLASLFLGELGEMLHQPALESSVDTVANRLRRSLNDGFLGGLVHLALELLIQFVGLSVGSLLGGLGSGQLLLQGSSRSLDEAFLLGEDVKDVVVEVVSVEGAGDSHEGICACNEQESRGQLVHL